MIKTRRVYKFLPQQYGLEALMWKYIKISEVGTLNDPFDLIPYDLSKPAIRLRLLHFKQELGKSHGLLCFSSRWTNPVLWAHYAENHRGFCLGFDVPDEMAATVTYESTPLQVKKPFNKDHVMKMMYTKYAGWEYEEEVRLWVVLKEKSQNGLYMFPYGTDTKLKEVIVGAANYIKQPMLDELLDRHPGVSCFRVRPAHKEFMMVKDNGGPAMKELLANIIQSSSKSPKHNK